MSRKDLEQYFAVQREIDQRLEAGAIDKFGRLNASNVADRRLRQHDETAEASLDAAGMLLLYRCHELGISTKDRTTRDALIKEHIETLTLKIYEVFSVLPPRVEEESSTIETASEA